MKDNPIIVRQQFETSVEEVWRAISVRDEMVKWFFDTIEEFKPEIGFKTKFIVETPEHKKYIHLWEVTEVLINKKLTYSWKYKDYSGDSYVEWILISQDDNQTLLTLTHYGQSSFPNDNSDFFRENCEDGWKQFINERLKNHLKKN
jgi:uncharacterized protein YndB with AHSA1/START domain